MNEFKGTPGPWEEDGVEIRGVTQHQSECICLMTPGFEREDALLIAAAPTLLSALEDCLKEMETYSHIGHPGGCKGAMEFNVRFDFAKAAIGKALGEQP